MDVYISVCILSFPKPSSLNECVKGDSAETDSVGSHGDGVQMTIKLSYHRFIYSTAAAIFDSYLITV